MSYTGTENFDITLTDASVLTKNYRTANPHEILGGYFSQVSIRAILKQEGCVGIRYYYGLQADGSKALVIVGVDSNQDDIVAGKIIERSWPCPTSCGAANELNS